MSHTPVVVIDIVGLSPALVGEHTPNLHRLATDGFIAPMRPSFPAVTCSSQSNMLTGALPRQHGIVGNGWYFRDTAEVRFWHQSNHLVQAPKVWETARERDQALKTSVFFWWYNMYSSAELSVTLRPMYPADGRKIPALYSQPPRLERELQRAHGAFPMFNFWGPNSNLRSSKWIAEAAATHFDRERPDLMFVYLPHLDYSHQQFGPSDPRSVRELEAIDRVAGQLIDACRARGAEIMVVSEYALEDASGTVAINQLLRDAGLIRVRNTLGWELLDAGASDAFAVCDHQIAHVYVKDSSKRSRVKALLDKEPGIERVLEGEAIAEAGLDHPRSGELICVAEPGHWFSYYYWLDDDKAPDFARTVDIHRKPGYDPVELFLDPDRPFVKAHLVKTLAKKKLGFRYLMDVIPLRPDLVKGTHGRAVDDPDRGAVLIGSSSECARDSLHITDVRDLILERLAASR